MSKYQQDQEAQTIKKPPKPQAAKNKDLAGDKLIQGITQRDSIPAAMLKRLPVAQRKALAQRYGNKGMVNLLTAEKDNPAAVQAKQDTNTPQGKQTPAGNTAEKTPNLEYLIKQLPASENELMLAINNSLLLDCEKILNQDDLLLFIKEQLSESKAVAFVGALLETYFIWLGEKAFSDPVRGYRLGSTSGEWGKDYTDFSRWIGGRVETRNKPYYSSGMNCWEGVLFAAYLAKVIDYNWLLKFFDDVAAVGAAAGQKAADVVTAKNVKDLINFCGYDSAKAIAKVKDFRKSNPNTLEKQEREEGLKAYQEAIKRKLGVTDAQDVLVGDKKKSNFISVPRGNLVFFIDNSELVHVTLALGTMDRRDGSPEVMSLWNRGFMGFERATVLSLIEKAKITNPNLTNITHAPPPWSK